MKGMDWRTEILLSRVTRLFLYGLLVAAPSILSASTIQAPSDELRALLKKAIVEADSFSDRFEAEVWLLDMSNRLVKKIPDDEKRLQLLKHIHYESTRAKLHPELVIAVIEVESNFERFAISTAGALGLMQVMPFWLKEIGRPGDNLFDIRTNLRLGCTILRYYLDKEKGDLTRALSRYNGSLYGTKYSNKIYKALGRRWYRR